MNWGKIHACSALVMTAAALICVCSGHKLVSGRKGKPEAKEAE
jgi:hypothetical protein